MLFGEIVEPTTRALITEDELEELPEYQEPSYEWEGDPHPPDNINALVFAETPKVLQVISSATKIKSPVAQLKNEGLAIYKFDNNYLVELNGNTKNLVIGEIVEILSPWILKAKAIHQITTVFISTFQPIDILPEDLLTFTRCLTNLEEIPFKFCNRLETPNLVKGLGASVLTYCINRKLKSTLWVIYTDSMPIDSVNSSEIVRLFKTLGFEVRVESKQSASVSNLYM